MEVLVIIILVLKLYFDLVNLYWVKNWLIFCKKLILLLLLVILLIIINKCFIFWEILYIFLGIIFFFLL